MKTLLLCALFGAFLTSAQAAPVSKLAAAPVAAKSMSAKSSDVVGVWSSAERTAVVAPGTMTLTADGNVTLAPEGFDPIKGTYVVKGQFLDIKMERGRATLIYSVSNGKMLVEYENGSVQSFTKQPALVAAQPKAKK